MESEKLKLVNITKYIYIYVYTHTHIHTYIQQNIIQPKKKGNSTMCYNMDKLKDILLSDISQGERQIMYGIISMWTLKENKSQFHKNRE